MSSLIRTDHINIDKNDKRYINYVINKEYPISSGCYIKSKGEFKNYDKYRTTINFYNKYSQLKYRINTPKEYDANISDKDLQQAKNVLRLEIQVGHKYLYECRKGSGITKELTNFFNIGFAYEVVKQKFEYFLGNSILDFYSGEQAIKRILADTSSGLSERQKKNLINYVNETCTIQLEQYRTLKKVDYEKSRKYKLALSILGIHDLFIPDDMKVNFLINPIKLLNEKYKKTLECMETPKIEVK